MRLVSRCLPIDTSLSTLSKHWAQTVPGVPIDIRKAQHEHPFWSAGIGEHEGSAGNPRILKMPKGINFARVACGTNHSLALSSGGQVGPPAMCKAYAVGRSVLCVLLSAPACLKALIQPVQRLVESNHNLGTLYHLQACHARCMHSERAALEHWGEGSKAPLEALVCCSIHCPSTIHTAAALQVHKLLISGVQSVLKLVL